MRFLYWGLPIGALLLENAGFVPSVVILQGAQPGARRLRKRLGPKGVLILQDPQTDDPFTQETIASVTPNLMISYFYPRRISPYYLDLVEQQAFGVHPSLLPRWRGPDPIFWTLYRGDQQTGVTLFRLAEAYDTGDILTQARVAVPEDANAHSLSLMLEKMGIHLLIDLLGKFSQGGPLNLRPQEHEAACNAPLADESLRAIRWNAPAAAIVRLIRAAAPYPGASTLIEEHDVDVLRASVDTQPPQLNLRPGEAAATPEGLSVRAADGNVLITRVRLASGITLQKTALHVLLQ